VDKLVTAFIRADKLLTQDLLHIVFSRANPSLFVHYYYIYGYLKIKL